MFNPEDSFSSTSSKTSPKPSDSFGSNQQADEFQTRIQSKRVTALREQVERQRATSGLKLDPAQIKTPAAPKTPPGSKKNGSHVFSGRK